MLCCGSFSPPRFDSDLTTSVSPGKIAIDRFLKFFVCFVVRVVQGEFFECGELAFNPIEPGSIGRREIELNVVFLGPCQHFVFEMGFVVVQNDVERFIWSIATP